MDGSAACQRSDASDSGEKFERMNIIEFEIIVQLLTLHRLLGGRSEGRGGTGSGKDRGKVELHFRSLGVRVVYDSIL